MRVDRAAFHAVVSMFTGRRPDLDEIEAVLTDSDVNRATALRVMEHYKAVVGGRGRVASSTTLDVQIEGGGGGEDGKVRVTVDGEAAMRRALDEDAWGAVAPVTRVIRKARVRPSVSLPEYRLRFNMKEEVPVPDAAGVLAALKDARGTRTFRLKRRFSFPLPPGAFRLDVTGVRQVAVAGAKLPSFAFLQAQPEAYELEIEFVGDAAKSSAAVLARDLVTHCNVLLKVVDDTDVLLGCAEKAAVQREFEALLASASASASASGGGAKGAAAGRAPARLPVGPKPVTLVMANLLPPSGAPDAPPSVRADYTLTDKADGERRVLMVAADGRVYTLDDRMNVRALAVRGSPAATRAVAGTLLDGEYISRTRSGGRMFAAFDAYVLRRRDLRALPLLLLRGGGGDRSSSRSAKAGAVDRVSAMAEAVAALQGGGGAADEGGAADVVAKTFLPIAGGDDVFKQCRILLSRRDAGGMPYDVDGLIFTPASLAVGAAGPGEPPARAAGTWRLAFKWKPPSQNTIDFLVRLRGEDDVVVDAAGQVHRQADLLVGQDVARPLTAMAWVTGAAAAIARAPRTYAAVPFSAPGRPACDRAAAPNSNADADAGALSLVHLPVGEDGRLRCESGEDLLDDTVVEFAFDAAPTACDRPLSRRWVPLRVRHDKTEKYVRTRTVTANSAQNALGVWSTIVDPVTEDVLCGRAPVQLRPLAAADADPDAAAAVDGLYYAKEALRSAAAAAAAGAGDEAGGASSTQAMRAFHNWVKREVLLLPAGRAVRARSLFDVGVGRAGDLAKWLDMGLSRVLGIDKFAANLEDPEPRHKAAYVRLIAAQQRWRGPAPFPRVVFLPMDATLPIGRDTIEGMDDAQGDRTVARVLWGLVPPSAISDARLRAFHGFAAGSGFDMVACMFALHYFFKDRATLATFARNVADALRPGGVLVGCCLDGGRVRALLADVPEGGHVDGGCPDADADADGAARPALALPPAGCAWRITRRFAGAAAPPPPKDAPPGEEDDQHALGQQVDVFMESIGQTLPEYLVDFQVLVRALAAVDVHPMSDVASKAAGLPGGTSTGTFDGCLPVWAARERGRSPAALSEYERRYSVLNRWFVFQKAATA